MQALQIFKVQALCFTYIEVITIPYLLQLEISVTVNVLEVRAYGFDARLVSRMTN